MPNVSYCEDNKDVYYNPIETRLVAKYNVTSTSGQTQIGSYQYISAFTEIEIDGVVQSSVVSAYTFDTLGEHTVKYTLLDSTSIGIGALSGCRSLTSATIPNSVTSIGPGSFSGCGLRSVTIPNSVTSIGSQAFASCSGLTSITIPNSVTNVESGASIIAGCANLKEIIYNANCGVPNGFTMYGTPNIEKVEIGNSVTSIGNSAFSNCSGLTSITIPDSVTNIGDDAFADCGLTSIISLATTAPTITNYTFQNIKPNGTLTVPSGSSGYDVWMGTGDYYLGKYGWTKVEQ